MSTDDVLELAGFVCLVTAGLLVHLALGFAVAGVLLVVAAQARALRRDPEPDDGAEAEDETDE